VTDSSPTSTTVGSSPELAGVLAQMGAVVLAAESINTTIELITSLMAHTLPGTTGAGVTLIDSRGKRTRAASNALVQQADSLQYELDTGPCLTAWRDQVTVRIDDTDAETRWPQWTAAVAGLGVRSMVSAPLLSAGSGIGAIKVYAGRPGVYDSRAEQVLELFARQASILLVNTQTLADARRLSAELTESLNHRDLVSQAKGVLMARGAPDAQAAFQLLVAAAERSNTKVHDVARQLVSAAQPGRPPQPAP